MKKLTNEQGEYLVARFNYEALHAPQGLDDTLMLYLHKAVIRILQECTLSKVDDADNSRGERNENT